MPSLLNTPVCARNGITTHQQTVTARDIMRHVLLPSPAESKLTKYCPQLFRQSSAWGITHECCPSLPLSVAAGCLPNSPTKSRFSTMMQFFPSQVSNSSRQVLVKSSVMFVHLGESRHPFNHCSRRRIQHSEPLSVTLERHHLRPKATAVSGWWSVCLLEGWRLDP